MLTRADALQALVCLDRPLGEITAILGQYPWDSDAELVALSRANVASVLDRFINNALTAIEVEDWANAIECRDDIGFEMKSNKLLKDAIWELANPILSSALTHQTAQALLDRLNL